MNLAARIDEYLHVLAVERRLSLHTIKATRRDLAQFNTFLAARDDVVDVHCVRQFAADGRRRGLKATTLQRMLSSLRGFFAHELEAGRVPANPVDGVRAPKRDKPLPKTLSVDQVTALLAPQGDAPLARRDHAMVELFYSSGLRLAELAGLDAPAIDLNAGEVRVLGKGRKERIVPVGRQAREALQHWLAARGSLAGVDETALFVSARGGRLSPRTIQQRLALWAQRAGLDVRLHPHRLRHSFASHVLQSSGNLRAVQELLGHANIATTQIYTHLDLSFLSQVYDSAHPRARRRDK